MICPFMSTPRQSDTIFNGTPLYENESEMERYGFTVIGGQPWSGIFPCLKEKCAAWDARCKRLDI